MRYTYCSYQLPSETCSISLCKRGNSANGVLRRPRGKPQERQLWRDRNQLVIERIAKMVDGYPEEIADFLSDLTMQNFSGLLYPEGVGWSVCNVPLCHPYVCDRYMGIFDNRGNLRDPTNPWSLNRLLLLLQRALNGQPLVGDAGNNPKAGYSANNPRTGDSANIPRTGDFVNIPKSKSKSESQKNFARQQNALPDIPATAGFAGTKRLSLEHVARRGSFTSSAPGLPEIIRTQETEGYYGFHPLAQIKDSQQSAKGINSYSDSHKTERKTEKKDKHKDSPKGTHGEDFRRGLTSPTHIEFDVQSLDNGNGYRVLHHVDSIRLSRDVYWLRKSQKAAEAKSIIKKHVERSGTLVNADSLTNAIRHVKFDDTPSKKKYREQEKELTRAISQMYAKTVEKKPPVEPSTNRKYVGDQVPVLFHAPYEKDKPWTWQRRHPKQLRITADDRIGSSHIKRYQRSSVQKELESLRKTVSIHSIFSAHQLTPEEQTPAPMFGQKGKKGHKRQSNRATITSTKGN